LLFAGWRLDLLRRELTDPGGKPVALTGGELALLRAFLDHPRHVLSRNQLMDLARGLDSEIYDRAVDLQVSRLRRKLEQGGGGDLIETVRGEGYRFTNPVRRS
jgi:two-component system OmpR family response regulator